MAAWLDADHDGCDTRDEVLIAEAAVAAGVGSGCSLSGDSGLTPGWLPQQDVCGYVSDWIAVKTRWNLSVDAEEARSCPTCSSASPRTTVAAWPPPRDSLGSSASGASPTAPATTAAPASPRPVTTAAPSASYPNCDAARAAGVAPIHRGEPGYSSKLDRDGDGIACE